ncbi:MAG: hypothetical protein ACLURV_11505 [Gallintestinimicrobium sp.]
MVTLRCVLSPRRSGSSYVFEQEVVGGAVPKLLPGSRKGYRRSRSEGPLAAYPVVGVKAVLYDGSYHPVDSSEMAFKMAASQALRRASWKRARFC